MFKRNAERKKPDRRVEDVPMTPMIDVVFQLLVFFVLTFEIPDRLSRMDVYRPAGLGTPGPGALNIGVHEEGFTLNGQGINGEDLERTFNRLADLNPSQNIIVVATGRSKHSQLVGVLDLLGKAGLESVSLLSSN